MQKSVAAVARYLKSHTPELMLGGTLLALAPLVNCGSGMSRECGDGSVNQPHEECDDGNTKDGDGCSSTCKTESDGTGGDGGAGGADGSGGSEPGTGGSDPGSGGMGGMGGADGSGGDAGTGGSDPGVDAKIIYVAPPTNGNIGIASADTHCTDNATGGGTYKAMVVDGATRVACESANCTMSGASENVDWVLAPDTTYERPDGTVIGTTNAAGIFEFPLDNGFPTGFYWTGLNLDWTSSGDDCDGWTGTAGFWGTEGFGDDTTNNAIGGSSISCAKLGGSSWACVEQ